MRNKVTGATMVPIVADGIRNGPFEAEPTVSTQTGENIDDRLRRLVFFQVFGGYQEAGRRPRKQMRRYRYFSTSIIED